MKQSRRCQLTINNPLKHGYTHEIVVEKLESFSFRYYCFAYEVGESGTEHLHIYIAFEHSARFEQVKRVFPEAHIELCKGTESQNIAYIKKEGKWADTDKSETQIEGSFFEKGTPRLDESKKKKSEELYKLINAGFSDAEILAMDKSAIFHLRAIRETRSIIMGEKFGKELRLGLKVIYLHGPTGSGKSRFIFENYPDNCRITDYGTNRNGVYFDAYHGEPVLVFEEFASQIPLQSMLNYLDIYPIKLPARYLDKTACYETVFIVSNLPIEEQYKDAPAEIREAFMRRINHIVEMKGNDMNSVTIQNLKNGYINTIIELDGNFTRVFDSEKNLLQSLRDTRPVETRLNEELTKGKWFGNEKDD